MSLESKKLELVNYILQVQNEALLEKVKSIFEKADMGVVARNISGETLTKQDYISEIKEAEEEIAKGNYLSHEAIKDEVAKW